MIISVGTVAFIRGRHRRWASVTEDVRNGVLVDVGWFGWVVRIGSHRQVARAFLPVSRYPVELVRCVHLRRFVPIPVFVVAFQTTGKLGSSCFVTAIRQYRVIEHKSVVDDADTASDAYVPGNCEWESVKAVVCVQFLYMFAELFRLAHDQRLRMTRQRKSDAFSIHNQNRKSASGQAIRHVFV